MNTPKLKILSQAMQAYAWRMEAVASNVANLDTPGYQRLEVRFEDALQDARHRAAGPEAETRVHPQMIAQDEAPVLEDELMDMADTQMRTQLASRALRTHFQMMRTSITGRTG